MSVWGFGWIGRKLKAEVVDRATGKYQERQAFIRKDREARELRLERRPMKWLNGKQQRAEKTARGLYDPTLSTAERIERATTPSVEWELPPAKHQVKRIEGEKEKALVPAIQTAPQRKHWLARVVEKVAPSAAKPEARHLTPGERGGFTPTPQEYVDQVVPEYVDTNEALERWRELQTAKKEFADACAKRDARPGPAACSGLTLLEKGHTWWKVPAAPRFECVECGENVSTVGLDLRRGKLIDIRRAVLGRYGRDALARLAAGDDAFLGITGPNAKTTLGAIREESAKMGEALEFVDGVDELARVPNDHVIDLTEHQYKEAEGTYQQCENCGMAKRSHRTEQVLVAGPVAGSRKRHVGYFWCPRHGVDAT